MTPQSVAIILALTILPAHAYAQVQPTPFFPGNGGVALYNPEIAVVASGPLLVVRPVVSHDLKYVSIASQASLTQVIRIQRFPVMTFAARGFVGGARPASNPRLIPSTPDAAKTPSTLLDRPGITWIAPP